MDQIERALDDIRREYYRAAGKFPMFNSTHEGYAVIKEELEELWDEIKGRQDDTRMREEAIQVGAMALRFMLDLCPLDEEGEGNAPR